MTIEGFYIERESFWTTIGILPHAESIVDYFKNERSSQYISGDEYDDCLWPPVGLFEQIVAPVYWVGISIQSYW